MKTVTIMVLLAGFSIAQVKPIVTQRTANERVNVVRLSPRYTTAIRLPEAVRSVAVGDPGSFLAEHSEREPTLVLVKPVTEQAAESNLLVTTVTGRQISFLLRSEAGANRGAIDFVVNYRPAASFFVEESAPGSSEVAQNEAIVAPGGTDALGQILERQQRARLPTLYGGDAIRAGISEVLDQGGQVVVLFSVLNPQAHAVEVLPPQIQLAGKVRRGFPVKRGRWATSQQLPIRDHRIARWRIGPGERSDGVVLFDRPGFKQSNETLFLQIAESGAVDRPALAPIGFGVSATRKEARHER